MINNEALLIGVCMLSIGLLSLSNLSPLIGALIPAGIFTIIGGMISDS